MVGVVSTMPSRHVAVFICDRIGEAWNHVENILYFTGQYKNSFVRHHWYSDCTCV